MTEEQIKIDALLTSAAERLVIAAKATVQIRTALRRSDTDTAQRASLVMHEHMLVVENAFIEAGRLIQIQSMAQARLEGLNFQFQKEEGLVN